MLDKELPKTDVEISEANSGTPPNVFFMEYIWEFIHAWLLVLVVSGILKLFSMVPTEIICMGMLSYASGQIVTAATWFVLGNSSWSHRFLENLFCFTCVFVGLLNLKKENFDISSYCFFVIILLTQWGAFQIPLWVLRYSLQLQLVHKSQKLDSMKSRQFILHDIFMTITVVSIVFGTIRFCMHFLSVYHLNIMMYGNALTANILFVLLNMLFLNFVFFSALGQNPIIKKVLLIAAVLIIISFLETLIGYKSLRFHYSEILLAIAFNTLQSLPLCHFCWFLTRNGYALRKAST